MNACEIIYLADKVSKSDVTLLLRGEAAREITLARYIHTNSPRVQARFLRFTAAPCRSSIERNFWLRKEAFTGQRPASRVNRTAQGEHYFLMKSERLSGVQVKLLRVLQTGSLNGWAVRALKRCAYHRSNQQKLGRSYSQKEFREYPPFKRNSYPLPPLNERMTCLIWWSILSILLRELSRPVMTVSENFSHPQILSLARKRQGNWKMQSKGR